MSCKPPKLTLLAVLGLTLAGLACRPSLAQTALGSVTITGTEQSSGSTWDTGTVTATINGVSVSFAYGRFSSPAAIASALGALISQKCGSQVYAKANGATLTLYQKGSNTITSASITSVSNNPSLYPSNSFLVSGGGSWSPPLISSLSMTEGPPGMGFAIYGANFGSTQGTVYIGGVEATVLSWNVSGNSNCSSQPNSDCIIVQVPSLAASSIPYDVVVETSTWWAFNTGTTTFQVDKPFGCN